MPDTDSSFGGRFRDGHGWLEDSQALHHGGSDTKMPRLSKWEYCVCDAKALHTTGYLVMQNEIRHSPAVRELADAEGCPAAVTHVLVIKKRNIPISVAWLEPKI